MQLCVFFQHASRQTQLHHYNHIKVVKYLLPHKPAPRCETQCGAAFWIDDLVFFRSFSSAELDHSTRTSKTIVKISPRFRPSVLWSHKMSKKASRHCYKKVINSPIPNGLWNVQLLTKGAYQAVRLENKNTEEVTSSKHWEELQFRSCAYVRPRDHQSTVGQIAI